MGIIGVAVGGGLTGITAVGTSMFQLRLARSQQESQEREAERQRRFESAKDLREARQTAYAAYLTVVQTFRDELDEYFSRGGDIDDPSESVTPFVERLDKRCTELTILGPPSVAEAARQVAGAINRIGQTYNPALPPVHDDIRSRVEEFVIAAGNAVAGIETTGRASIVAVSEVEGPRS